MKRTPALASVPLITEFGRTDAEKAYLQIYGIAPEIGRSLAAPPRVPKDRVNLWRVAFLKMLDDPESGAAVSKGNVRLDPLDGETLTAIVARIVGLPGDTVTKARNFYDRLLTGEVKP